MARWKAALSRVVPSPAAPYFSTSKTLTAGPALLVWNASACGGASACG